MLKLTKQKAIEEHRKMWNWIAEQKENGNNQSVYYLKKQWCNEHGVDILNKCFCCEYNRLKCEKNGENWCTRCIYCPLIWGTETETNNFYCEHGMYILDENGYTVETGLWSIADKCIDNKECANICRKIASLEVKENV